MASAGHELIYNSVKMLIKAPQDSILCILHWHIVSSGYRCIGVGEMDQTNDSAEGSEMIPDGWNITPDHYFIRYKKADTSDTFTLKVITVDGTLLVHFWKDSEDHKVPTMNIKIADFATEDYSSYKKALVNVTDLCTRFNKEVLNELKPSTSKTGSSRTEHSTRKPNEDPLRVPNTGRRYLRHAPEWNDPDDPLSIGHADLDPFRHGGAAGGMLFDPFRGSRGPRFNMDPSAGLPEMLPHGAVPPGARFNPFGPPGMRSGPDPDHMQPPGYDDMFM